MGTYGNTPEISETSKGIWFISVAKMPWNVEISRDEICRIRAFKAKSLKDSEICQKTGRSRAAVYKVLSETYTWNSKKRSGRPRKTTERLDRKIMRFVSSQYLKGVSQTQSDRTLLYATFNLIILFFIKFKILFFST